MLYEVITLGVAEGEVRVGGKGAGEARLAFGDAVEGAGDEGDVLVSYNFV